MRFSRFPIHTRKESPADAEVVSAQLLLRGGFIQKLASGLYTWTPLGLRVLRKVEAIVREEMNQAGALEVLMPAVQPAELWQETGRWGKMGEEMLRLKDRHDRDFCFGPTHEEVITDFVRQEYKSYKQLPVNYYQIQTKFRDERRPRFGLMRAREFLMKDAYSFHLTQASLEAEYQNMRETYIRIFTRVGVDFRVVQADSGNIGGSASEEFHVLAKSGEDLLAVSSMGDYAANIEAALPVVAENILNTHALAILEKKQTKNLEKCEAVAEYLKVDIQQTIKSIAIMAEHKPYLLLMRGDHTPQEIKIKKININNINLSNYRLATEQELSEVFGTVAGYIGALNLNENINIIADYSVANLTNFVMGANEKDHHYVNVNWERDVPKPHLIADLRNVMEGEATPVGGVYEFHRGIEVGHIFQLGKKYAESMQLAVLNENGQNQTVTMGCYGIGVSRVVAAVIEQRNDAQGICWPESLAPFRVVICPMGYKKSATVKQTSDLLYAALQKSGIEVLLDDRDVRPGVMFADAELIGISHRLVIGDKGLSRNIIEYKSRTAQASEEWAANMDEIVAKLA